MNQEHYLGRECRFVTHVPGKFPGDDDYHVIKEQVVYKDGKTVPNVRVVKNYKRSFWVTKPALRNHNSKKEREKVEKVLVF